MDKKQQEIFWQGQLVGYMVLVGAEMWRIYGEWIPLQNQATVEFLNKLKNGEDLTVIMNTPYGGLTEYLVTSEPDDELGLIEVRMKL